MDSHYVTRSLTKPWECSNRKLCYYSFGSGEIKYNYSKSLFTKEDLLTDEQEKFYSDLIESPIGKIKKKILNNEKVGKVDWATFRSFYLYFLCQTQRYQKYSEEQKDEGTELLSSKEKSFVDNLVIEYSKKNSIKPLKIDNSKVLCFPETGFFPFPVFDGVSSSGWTICYAVPLFPSLAAVLYPNSLQEDKLNEATRFLDSYSVGIADNCKRIVIHSEIPKHNSEKDIKKYMEHKRKVARNVFGQINDIKQVVAEIYKAAGFLPKQPKK